MYDNDREPRIGRSKDVIYSVTLIVSVVFTLGFGGFIYWYYWMRTDYSAVNGTLGISPLPLSVQIDSKLSARLDPHPSPHFIINKIVNLDISSRRKSPGTNSYNFLEIFKGYIYMAIEIDITLAKKSRESGRCDDCDPGQWYHA